MSSTVLAIVFSAQFQVWTVAISGQHIQNIFITAQTAIGQLQDYLAPYWCSNFTFYHLCLYYPTCWDLCCSPSIPGMILPQDFAEFSPPSLPSHMYQSPAAVCILSHDSFLSIFLIFQVSFFSGLCKYYLSLESSCFLTYLSLQISAYLLSYHQESLFRLGHILLLQTHILFLHSVYYSDRFTFIYVIFYSYHTLHIHWEFHESRHHVCFWSLMNSS